MRITIDIDGNGGVRVAPAAGPMADADATVAADGGAARGGDGAPNDRRASEPAREVPGPSTELRARIEAAIGRSGPAADAGRPRVS